MQLSSQLDYLRPLAIDNLVRIGRKKDGGYVLPKRLAEDTDCLLTFGVSTDWNFEKRFKSINKDAHIVAYDHTVGFIVFLNQAIKDTNKVFNGFGGLKYTVWRWKVLADYLVSGRVMVHHRCRVVNKKELKYDTTIDEIFQRNPESKRILLKMDIEGFEYEVISELLRYEERMIGMMVEFHHIARDRGTFERGVKELQQYFDIVHIHGNNFCGLSKDGLPDVLELTFVSKRLRATQGEGQAVFPISGLDYPCDPNSPDLPIEFEMAGD